MPNPGSPVIEEIICDVEEGASGEAAAAVPAAAADHSGPSAAAAIATAAQRVKDKGKVAKEQEEEEKEAEAGLEVELVRVVGRLEEEVEVVREVAGREVVEVADEAVVEGEVVKEAGAGEGGSHAIEGEEPPSRAGSRTYFISSFHLKATSLPVSLLLFPQGLRKQCRRGSRSRRRSRPR